MACVTLTGAMLAGRTVGDICVHTDVTVISSNDFDSARG